MSNKKGASLDIEEHRRAHTSSSIADRLEEERKHHYLKDFVYGAIDGTVTTFAVVTGVAGAGLSSGVVIVLGIANLVADGFSMAASNFLGTRAEAQLRAAAEEEERFHIQVFPEGEREEVRQIFKKKGFSGEELDSIVDVITSDRTQWINTMLQDEYGLSLSTPLAWKAAGATFAAFLAVGAIPILPFVLNALFGQFIERPFLVSSVLTGAAFFFVGAMKSRYVRQHWLLAGLETMLIGGLAASFAYILGVALKGLL